MNTNYRIGTLAEKLVAIRIDRDGTITPICRRREPGGRMVDRTAPAVRRHSSTTGADFVARVAPGHSGVVCVKPPIWMGYYAAAVIPLGPESAFADEELGMDDRERDDAAPNGNAEEVWFHFADGRLTWKSENVCGEAIVNASYPELLVILRLPAGNDGEISFAAPMFATAEGQPASVLSVA